MRLYTVARIKNPDNKIFGYRIIDIDTGEIKDVPLNTLREVLGTRKISIKNMKYNNGSLQGIAYSLDNELPVFYLEMPNYESFLTILERLVIDNKPFFLVADIYGKLAIIDYELLSTLKFRIKNTSFVKNDKINPLVGQFKIDGNKFVELNDKLIRDLESEVGREDIIWTVEDFSMYMKLKNYHVNVETLGSGLRITDIDPKCEIIHLPEKSSVVKIGMSHNDKPRTLIVPCCNSLSIEGNFDDSEESPKQKFNKIVFQSKTDEDIVRLNRSVSGSFDYMMINELKFYPKVDYINGYFNNSIIHNLMLQDNTMGTVDFCFNNAIIHNLYAKNQPVSALNSSNIVNSFNNSEVPFGLGEFKTIKDSFCYANMTNAPIQEIIVNRYSMKVNGSFTNVPKVMYIEDKTMVELNKSDKNTTILGIKTIGKNKGDRLYFSNNTVNDIRFDGIVFEDVETLGRYAFTGYHLETLSMSAFPKVKRLGRVSDNDMTIDSLVFNGKEKITLCASFLETAKVSRLAVFSDVTTINDIKGKRFMPIDRVVIINEDAERIAKDLSDYARVILAFRNVDEFNEYNKVDASDEALFNKIKFVGLGNKDIDRMIANIGKPHKDLLRIYQLTVESKRDPLLDDVVLDTSKLTNLEKLRSSIEMINKDNGAYCLKQYSNMLTHIYPNLLCSLDAKSYSRILADLESEKETVKHGELSIDYNSLAICIKISDVNVYLALRSKSISPPRMEVFESNVQKLKVNKNEDLFRNYLISAHALKISSSDNLLTILRKNSFIIAKSANTAVEYKIRYFFYTKQYAITKQVKDKNETVDMVICEVADTFDEIVKYSEKYNIESPYEMKDLIADYAKQLINAKESFDVDNTRTLYVADWLDSNNIVSPMLMTNEAFDLMEEAGILFRIPSIRSIQLKMLSQTDESDRIKTTLVSEPSVKIKDRFNIEPYNQLVIDDYKYDRFNEIGYLECYIISYKEKPGKYRHYISVLPMYKLLQNLITLSRYKEVRDHTKYAKLNGIVDGDLKNPNIFQYFCRLDKSFSSSINTHLAVEFETGYTYIIVEQNDMYYGTAFRFNSIMDAFKFDSMVSEFSETLYYNIMSRNSSSSKFPNIFLDIRNHIIDGYSIEDKYRIIKESMKKYPELSAYTDDILLITSYLSHQPAGIVDYN